MPPKGEHEPESTQQQITPAPNAWKPPLPRELPELRARMVKFVESDVCQVSMAHAINTGRGSMLPLVPGYSEHLTPGLVAAPLLAELEQRRLNEATLFYASSDMTSLAVAAAQTPPAEPFSSRRLPSESGLIVFEEPIGGYTMKVNEASTDWAMARPELTVTTPIVGASWSRWTPDDVYLRQQNRVQWYANGPGGLRRLSPDFSGVWITFYGAAHDRFGEISPDEPIGRDADGSVITAGEMNVPQVVPELAWDNESVISWGTDLSEPAQLDSTTEWVHVLYTAWQLMTQKGGKTPLTETEEVQPNRARRRRDSREGITGPSTVRVVRVHTAHRPPAEASEQDAAQSSGRAAPNWSCRWPVRPHRRYVCLNPRRHADGDCEHEDRVIPAHIKGPADKPLRLPKTVNLWDSQPD